MFCLLLKGKLRQKNTGIRIPVLPATGGGGNACAPDEKTHLFLG